MIKNIKLVNNILNNSIIDFATNIIWLISFPTIEISWNWILRLEWLSSLFSKLFRKLESKIKAINFSGFGENGWSYDPKLLNSNLNIILWSYEMNPSAYWLFKFLVNSNIINSIEQIHFEYYLDIDLNWLLKLITKHIGLSKYRARQIFSHSHKMPKFLNL